jgi:hypothetical protein
MIGWIQTAYVSLRSPCADFQLCFDHRSLAPNAPDPLLVCVSKLAAEDFASHPSHIAYLSKM